MDKQEVFIGTICSILLCTQDWMYTNENNDCSFTGSVYNGTASNCLTNVRTMYKVKQHSCYQPKHNVSYWLNNYYKYIVVRDPLERLVSAYHKKLTTKDTFIDYKMLQKKILQYYRNNSTVLQSEFPSFSEFTGFLLHSKESFDKHFILAIELCDPCRTKYDFYVNNKP